MYERSLNVAEIILSVQKEPLVPVFELWEEVLRRSKNEGFEVASLPDFSALMEGDRRFQIIPAQINNQEDREESEEGALTEIIEMEQLGFFSEDRVRLRIANVAVHVITEDEEEVGSIRRRAFTSQTTQIKKNTVKKKTNDVSKNHLKKIQNRNSSPKKINSTKRAKLVKSMKSKTRTRGKK